MPTPRPRLTDRFPATTLLAFVLIGTAVLTSFLLEAAGEILEAVDEGDGIALWDRPVLNWAVANRAPLTTSFLWFTQAGGPIVQPILMAVVGLFLWWRWKDPTPAVLLVVAEAGALTITLVGKRLVGRPRPPIEDAVPPYETSGSFPSGHTLQAFVVAAMLAYLLIRHLWDHPRWQRVVIGVVGFAYASLMGFSRVFLGYHWLTDVLAAAALGLAWSFAVIACHRVWRTVRHRHEPHIEEERKDRPVGA